MLTTISNAACTSLSKISKIQLNSPQNILKKVNNLILPAILFLGAQAIQGVDSLGCIGCIVCLAGGGGPACIPICVLCGVTIPIPTG